MTESSRAFLALASTLLEYPDEDYFTNISALKSEIETNPALFGDAAARAVLSGFLESQEKAGAGAAREKYVAVFDHDPAGSLYLSWHRYGNDRSQGKAMAALNGLYRASGFEPVDGVMPDYLPRMLEFLSVCEDWAAEVILDGFGPELDALEKHLAEVESPHAPLLQAALLPLRQAWPERFKPRTGPDLTARPMARAKQDLEPLMPLREGE